MFGYTYHDEPAIARDEVGELQLRTGQQCNMPCMSVYKLRAVDYGAAQYLWRALTGLQALLLWNDACCCSSAVMLSAVTDVQLSPTHYAPGIGGKQQQRHSLCFPVCAGAVYLVNDVTVKNLLSAKVIFGPAIPQPSHEKYWCQQERVAQQQGLPSSSQNGSSLRRFSPKIPNPGEPMTVDQMCKAVQAFIDHPHENVVR